MRCFKNRCSTPLERFAASLTRGDVDTPQEFPILFPMYTVLLDVVLQMTSVRPHEQLVEEGALTIFKEGMGQALFVSHQWVTKSHPDPEFKQFRVLQEALQNIMSGVSQVSTDMITEAIFGLTKALSASELQPGKLFLWYDYFCCPQDPVLTLHCSGQKAGNAIESNQQRAISSIPAYISKCKFFMALCPVVESPDESQVFSQFTWAGRGSGYWFAGLNNAKGRINEGSGRWAGQSERDTEQEITTPLTVDSPGDGQFSVEQDRAAVAPVLKSVLKSKLLMHLVEGDFVNYRILLNQQNARLRGLPAESNDDLVPGFEPPSHAGKAETALAKFLYQNGFKHPLERDKAGWSTLCYASVRGDPDLVQALLSCRANPNDKITRAQPQLGIDKGISVRGILQTALSCACYVDDAEAVHRLCDSGGDPNETNTFGVSALRQACVTGSLHAMAALFEHTDKLDMSLSLHWVAMGQGGSAKAIDMLINARADVNERYRPNMFSPFGMLWRIKGLQHNPGGKTTQLRIVGYHHYGATPLMIAIICGNYEAAAALLVRGARCESTNSPELPELWAFVPGRDKGYDGCSPASVKFSPAGIHVVVQRCSKARLLLAESEDKWAEVGRGLVLHVSFSKGAASEAGADSEVAARCLKQAAKSLLTAPLSSSGQWQSDHADAESVLKLCSRGEAQSLLIVPQASLVCKLELGDRNLKYHQQCPRDTAAALPRTEFH
ncbi:dtd2 [Symbiodinium sp. CCMP2592]|nr:dtd2 [Symbiodinium sp. CCMP2592]